MGCGGDRIVVPRRNDRTHVPDHRPSLYRSVAIIGITALIH